MTDEQKAARKTLIASNKGWVSALLTELRVPLDGAPREAANVDQVRRKLLEGQIGLFAVGAVRESATGLLPFVVVDDDGAEIGAFSIYLRDLVLTDMSPLTVIARAGRSDRRVDAGIDEPFGERQRPVESANPFNERRRHENRDGSACLFPVAFSRPIFTSATFWFLGEQLAMQASLGMQNLGPGVPKYLAPQPTTSCLRSRIFSTFAKLAPLAAVFSTRYLP